VSKLAIRTRFRNLKESFFVAALTLVLGKNCDIEKLAFRLYERKVVRSHGNAKDFSVFHLDKVCCNALLVAFDAAKKIDFHSDNHFNFISSRSSKESIQKLNENNSYVDGNSLVKIIDNFLTEHKFQILDAVSSPYRVVNIRAWEMLPAKESFGPSEWHTDGFHDGHLKIMLYLTELSIQGGTVQLWKQPPFESSPGLVLIFRNSNLLHRAVSGTSRGRKLIEITIQRTQNPTRLSSIVGEVDDRHLIAPWMVDRL